MFNSNPLRSTIHMNRIYLFLHIRWFIQGHNDDYSSPVLGWSPLKANNLTITVYIWKWRNDRRSECNVCNCLKKPEKNSGLQWGLNPWPHDYQCDALPTELWSHWRWPGENNESLRQKRQVLNFFQASLRNCINCIHCDDHFFIFISFPQFIYDLFHIIINTVYIVECTNRFLCYVPDSPKQGYLDQDHNL